MKRQDQQSQHGFAKSAKGVVQIIGGNVVGILGSISSTWALFGVAELGIHSAIKSLSPRGLLTGFGMSCTAAVISIVFLKAGVNIIKNGVSNLHIPFTGSADIDLDDDAQESAPDPTASHVNPQPIDAAGKIIVGGAIGIACAMKFGVALSRIVDNYNNHHKYYASSIDVGFFTKLSFATHDAHCILETFIASVLAVNCKSFISAGVSSLPESVTAESVMDALSRSASIILDYSDEGIFDSEVSVVGDSSSSCSVAMSDDGNL